MKWLYVLGLILIWFIGFGMGKFSVLSPKRDMTTFRGAPLWAAIFNFFFIGGLVGLVSGKTIGQPNVLSTIVLMILTIGAGGSVAYLIQYYKEITASLDRSGDKIEYRIVRDEIKKIAQKQSLTGLDPLGEAKRIRGYFKLDELDRIGDQIGASGRYPPNVLAAVGVLLDSYPPELAAFMIAFCFPGGLRSCIMMALEDVEKIEQFIESVSEGSRIDQAAKVIAEMLCLMDSCSLARETFHGMVSPSMREMVKRNLHEISPEISTALTQ